MPPRKSRDLRPGMRFPVVKVIARVEMTADTTVLTFDDGSTMRLALGDSIEVD